MSDTRLGTRIWFITGTSSGFGRAFAEHALAQGDNVVATARDIGRLSSLVEQAPDRVLAVTLDVSRSGDADTAVKLAMERFGRIDILVNNAGYSLMGAVEETDDSELRAVMETNFFGAMAVTRAALPILRAQRSGAIVNISSMGGQTTHPGFSAYSASKFAIEGASEALAGEMAPFGVKVLIVEPGQFRTEITGSAMRYMPSIDAYYDVLGEMRALIDNVHRTQPGDPRKAAIAIEKALAAESTPLRLPVGGDAVDEIRAHAQQQLRQMEEWEAVSRATDLDPV